MEQQEPKGLKHIYAKMSSETAEDLIFRNHSLLELATLYVEKCDLANAVECLEKVKTEALQFHLYQNYFQSIALLLRIFAERLEFDKLQSLLREVTQVGESLSDFERYKSKINYNQGIAACYRNSFKEAEPYFQTAKDAAEACLKKVELSDKDRSDLCRDLINAKFGLATIAYERDEYDLALMQFDTLLEEVMDFSLEEKESRNYQDLEACIFIVQGNCYRCSGQYQKSLDCLWRAHGKLKTQKNWSYYYSVLLGLGRTYHAMEDNTRAVIFFDLISDAVADMELFALKEELQKANFQVKSGECRLVIDRERKVVIEKSKGEVHFERRFILLEILYLLASEPGKIFTKDSLVERIWKESYNPMIHDSKVYTSISRLRKLIEPDFKRPRYILNERDGYSFNPSIQVEELGNWRRGLSGVGTPEAKDGSFRATF